MSGALQDMYIISQSEKVRVQLPCFCPFQVHSSVYAQGRSAGHFGISFRITVVGCIFPSHRLMPSGHKARRYPTVPWPLFPNLKRPTDCDNIHLPAPKEIRKVPSLARMYLYFYLYQYNAKGLTRVL